MKWILFAILVCLTVNVATAQDGQGTRKKFILGMSVTPSVDWWNATTVDAKAGSPKIKFGYGVMAELGFGDNYALVIGLEHRLTGASIEFNDYPHYFTEEADTFSLKERNYKLDHVNIPLTLKLMTNQIGYFTYFGKFGVDVSVLARARADDKGYLGNDIDNTVESNDRNIYSEVSMFEIGLNVGAGAEWNFSGSTSLLFGVSYHHGFIDILRDSDKDGVRTDQELGRWSDAPINSITRPLEQKANPQYVTLDVGVLF